MIPAARALCLVIFLGSTALCAGCESRIVLGGACTRSGECAAPLVCASGRCRAECVEHADCPLGARCRFAGGTSGTCELPGLEPACGSTPDCPTGLVCAAGACADPCATEADCPGGSECVALAGTSVSFCVDRRSTSDAGPLDAGPAGDVADAGVCDSPPCDPVVSIAAAGSSACAITAGGALYCWGANDTHLAGSAPAGGRTDCGDGTEACAPRPARITAGRALSIDVGGGFACGDIEVTAGASPELWCWGANARGQTGTLETTVLLDVPMPVRREGTRERLPNFYAYGLGATHSVAVLYSAPHVVGWGTSARSELGGAAPPGDHPGFVVVDTHDQQEGSVALGAAFGCVSLAFGESGALCWGANDRGQLGLSNTTTESATGNVVTAGARMQHLAAGGAHVCALVGDVGVHCWGDGERGQLATPGFCDTRPDCYSPTPVPIVFADPPSGSTQVVAVSADATGALTCLLLEPAGDVYCWGDFAPPGAPPEVSELALAAPSAMALDPVEGIAVGTGFVCGIIAGDVWCWGENGRGELGRGELGTPGVPAEPMRVSWP